MTAKDPRFRFFGNVDVGGAVAHCSRTKITVGIY